MSAASFLRRLILRLAESPSVSRFVGRYGPKMGAYRFVAGDRLEDALEVVARLNGKGIMVTLDRLGEGRVDRSYALAARDAYVEILGAIARANLQASVSLKLTQLGLDLDPSFAEENLRAVLTAAEGFGNFVRIDMEDAPRTEATVSLFERVRRDHRNVGLVLQAYLFRSGADLLRLDPLDANLRIVKGAYMEPPSVAFPSKADVDANFKKLVAAHMGRGHYTAVATHDAALIAWTKDFVREQGISRDRFEFQMLYGVRSRLQEDLVREGYRVRVYVPFGPDWYPYFMRRLAERPANLGFFLKSLLRG